MRILLAEDDYATRKYMMAMLSKYGDCDVAVDGIEAVDAYMMAYGDDEPYELICLDLMMPIMNGFQVLTEIRNLEKTWEIPEDKAAKVIVTTALDGEEDQKMAYEIGCTVYSIKPVIQENLEQDLKKLGLL